MKKIIDKRIITINALILGIGFIAGIIFLIFTGALDKLIIKSEITEFYQQIATGEISELSSFLTSLKYNITYITLITISGIIFIFTPLILFINFYKGLLLGFLMSSVILTYKLKGILFSILLIFPHHIIMSIGIIIYSSIILHFSYKLMTCTYKNENINLKTFIKKIGIIYTFGLILSLMSSILEIYINPLLIRIFL